MTEDEVLAAAPLIEARRSLWEMLCRISDSGLPHVRCDVIDPAGARGTIWSVLLPSDLLKDAFGKMRRELGGTLAVMGVAPDASAALSPPEAVSRAECDYDKWDEDDYA